MTGLNFDRLRAQASDPTRTLTNPEDLYRALPKTSPGFDYLRGPQDQILKAWDARRHETDLVIKMNTGGGKTFVGLLIARSWLNEGVSPVAYLVPDRFLTEQVQKQAEILDISTTDDPASADYLQGKSVLVASFARVFNGKSIFGISGTASKPQSSALQGIVIDDAHASIAQAKKVFRLRIASGTEGYEKLFELFSEDIKEQSQSSFLDLEARRKSAIQEIPFWAWQAKQNDVLSILHPMSENELKWGWSLVVDSLPLCTAVITNNEFEIWPPYLPTDVLTGFANAQRRVYLSATLADDSSLVRHFGASEETVAKPIFPQNAGDLGTRMILTPQQLLPAVNDADLRDFILSLAKQRNVVVIVPSHARAEFWKEHAARILDRDNIHEGIEELANNPQLGLVVFVNRYDGIDLPYDMCHILVIDGVPEALEGGERLEQSRVTTSNQLLRQQIQLLEQGMGRATRSHDDHAVILLLGSRLIHKLNSPVARSFFSPATRRQLELADELASALDATTLDSLRPVIDQSLNEDEGWIRYHAQKLADLRYDAPVIVETAADERIAFDKALMMDHAAAVNHQQHHVIKKVASVEEEAVHTQQLAAYTNFFDPDEAQQKQKSARLKNRNLIRPIQGVQYVRAKSSSLPQANQVCSWLQNTYASPNELLIGVSALLEDLRMGTNHQGFESSIHELAFHLGHIGDRPDGGPDGGPDNLWALYGNEFYILEAKNEVKAHNNVSKNDAKQLSNSMDWFRERYPSSKGVPILVHPNSKFDRGAAIPQGCRVIDNSKLEKLSESIRSYAYGLATNEAFRSPSAVSSLLASHQLNRQNFIATFTVAGRR